VNLCIAKTGKNRDNYHISSHNYTQLLIKLFSRSDLLAVFKIGVSITIMFTFISKRLLHLTLVMRELITDAILD